MHTTPRSAIRPWKPRSPLPLYNTTKFKNATQTIIRRTYRPVLLPQACRSVFTNKAKTMRSITITIIIIRRLTPAAIATLVDSLKISTTDLSTPSKLNVARYGSQVFLIKKLTWRESASLFLLNYSIAWKGSLAAFFSIPLPNCLLRNPRLDISI